LLALIMFPARSVCQVPSLCRVPLCPWFRTPPNDWRAHHQTDV